VHWLVRFLATRRTSGVFRLAFSCLEARENTTMSVVWEELTLGLLDAKQLLRVFTRLLAATLLGAAIGFQRERAGKPAGLRTHTLVSLGTTLLILSCTAVGMSLDGLSRVIQGIITGIGFIGAGSILKLSEEHAIRGLTTAASIWVTAAVGVAVGLGSVGIALLSTLLALIILALVGRLEHRIERQKQTDTEEE
jgi:putative Mg2+ transporter-C (MgtC) family protein